MKLFRIFILVGIILFIGCSEDSDSNNPTGTTNHAPEIRSLTANNTDVGRQETTSITCVATDSDGDSLTYFWRASSGSIGGYDQAGATEQWRAPNTNGNYWITVTVSDGREVDIDSLELTVIPPNEPPAAPWDPTPPNGSVDNDRPVTLTWKCSDVDGDPITYDIYFGTSNPSSIIARDLDTTLYILDDLSTGALYYWRIVARDDHGNTVQGPSWYFRTQ